MEPDARATVTLSLEPHAAASLYGRCMYDGLPGGWTDAGRAFLTQVRAACPRDVDGETLHAAALCVLSDQTKCLGCH